MNQSAFATINEVLGVGQSLKKLTAAYGLPLCTTSKQQRAMALDGVDA